MGFKRKNCIEGCDCNLQSETSKRGSTGYVLLETTANYGTIGGRKGHICRRFCHILLSCLSPFLYFGLPALAETVFGTDDEMGSMKLTSILVALNITVELTRLKCGVLSYGMRSYERNILSAQFWGGMGICLVLLGSPVRPDFNGECCFFTHRIWIGGPLLWSMGIVDPFIGEMKSRGFSLNIRSLIGCLMCATIFIVCTLNGLGTPWWFSLVYPPIIVLSEFAGGLVRIDDNGLMLIVPLLMTYVFLPWV